MWIWSNFSDLGFLFLMLWSKSLKGHQEEHPKPSVLIFTCLREICVEIQEVRCKVGFNSVSAFSELYFFVLTNKPTVSFVAAQW